MTYMTRIAAMLFALAALAAPAPASAQAWPAKPVRLIVPFPPGSTDTVARAIASRLSERLGQQVLVENRPGAGGMVGAEAAAKSAPDGYTLLMVTLQHYVMPFLYKKLPYDIEHDFVPVTLVGNVALAVTVRPTLPVISITELIAYARQKPGALNFASSGNGGSIHLAGELFKRQARVEMTHVPYKGSGPAITDLIGGQVDLMFADLTSAKAQINAGKLRALAVTTPQPSLLMPGLPTVSASGLPGYEVSGWYGLVAPAGTPKDIIARLNAEVVGVLGRQELKDVLLFSGVEVAPGTPEQLNAHLKSEMEKWGGVVRDAGIKPD